MIPVCIRATVSTEAFGKIMVPLGTENIGEYIENHFDEVEFSEPETDFYAPDYFEISAVG